ncbi:MAG: type II methionyl aminopeptidase [Candidatus Methanosuratincola sp.]|uniref:Methionine aminopeptidase n=2 Tax=Candidatus Methanosuratincola (ex Vanwonterghem et al. 2016) TaxID=1915412 RepID=A0A7J3UZ03_9CREN|nr:type II methionyl aminopeptidase [Candidatus Methanosuratincola sp.]
MFNEEDMDKLLLAGRIARTVRQAVPRMVVQGASVLGICEWVESEIARMGGKPAFPCNVSINEVGAHYTSPPSDATVVPDGALVKVDLGVHIDGFIADTAVTVSVGSEYEDMVRAVEIALERGVQAVRVGGKIGEVGPIVEKTIRSMGYKPIRNLTGHQIEQYTIHSGLSIPNVSGAETTGKFQPWSVYAIEPFATLPRAEGEVIEREPGNILHLMKLKRPKSEPQRGAYDEIYRRFRTLPFARRWVASIGEGVRGLLAEKALYEYPVLVEASGMPIAQAEHTVITTDRESIVTT